MRPNDLTFAVGGSTTSEYLVHGGYLAADFDDGAPGRLTRSRDRPLDVAGLPPQISAGDICGEARDALHVVSVVFSGLGPRADRRDIPEQERIGTGALDWQSLDVGDRVYHRVGDLDMDLVADAQRGVGPVVRDDEPARRRGGQERTCNLGDGDIAEPRLLPVSVRQRSPPAGACLHRGP